MKYYTEKPDIEIKVFGKSVRIDHPVYRFATLFEENSKGIYVVQQHFLHETKSCVWGEVDPWIANLIYLSPNWVEFFQENASNGKEKDYPIWQIRKLMWKLRMKPLPRELWEDYFGRER